MKDTGERSLTADWPCCSKYWELIDTIFLVLKEKPLGEPA